MKDLKQVTVIGLGLLGGSITLAITRSFPGVKTIGFTHRPATRQKARQLAIATGIMDDVSEAVSSADLVILATPISTFPETFRQIADFLPVGCIVTDVGSTKTLPHRWASENLPSTVHYVGSHPIAGSEQRGVEYSRDDLFDQALCILTRLKNTDSEAVDILEKFWSKLGCIVKHMSPSEHDRIFASISHLPHIAAAALVNSANQKYLEYAGKGFVDTSRIASGPANIWADILMTNAGNCITSIDKLIAELEKIKDAISNKNEKKVENLLEKAREKRNEMINYKMKKRELI